jgi:hypothetical protein
MVLGASALNFARNRRAVVPQASTRGEGSRRLLKNMPIHDVFRERHKAFEAKVDLTNTKLDVLITEVVSRHPEMEDIVAYGKQWAKTGELSSIQLLSILHVAITDEAQHLHFDYVSMHARCATLPSAIRESFLLTAEAQT